MGNIEVTDLIKRFYQVIIVILFAFLIWSLNMSYNLDTENSYLIDENDLLRENLSSQRSRIEWLTEQKEELEEDLLEEQEKIESMRSRAKIQASIGRFYGDTSGRKQFRVVILNYGDSQAEDVSVFCGVKDVESNEYQYGFVGSAGNVAGQESVTKVYEMKPENDVDDATALCMTVDCQKCELLELESNTFQPLYEFYLNEYRYSAELEEA